MNGGVEVKSTTDGMSMGAPSVSRPPVAPTLCLRLVEQLLGSCQRHRRVLRLFPLPLQLTLNVAVPPYRLGPLRLRLIIRVVCDEM